ncbi:acetyltransferase [Cupriavidus necator]|uniref:acetyltransferase n=1 Tax=Cupriavidus necator TaxID=106590 RepID=UPI00339D5007
MPLLNAPRVLSVVIAGAGGFALEIFEYLEREARRGGPRIAGFIDDDPGKALDGIDLPHLGTTRDYHPDDRQAVIVAVGAVEARREIIGRLAARCVAVPTYVHGAAIVSDAATIGPASIICPLAIVNRGAALGTGVLVNVHASVSHGASVGDYSVLSPGAILNGDAAVGACCFLGTRATLYPGVRIGDHCVVDSHTGVSNGTGERKFITSGLQQVTARRIAV